MKFLLDTNCWLQIVRVREHIEEVRLLLAHVPASEILTTEFSLYSIALVMRRHKVLDDFPTFVTRSGIGRVVGVIRIAPEELTRVVEVCKLHNLDFDDAYQYVAAEFHGLKPVSLDADFDRTPNGRVTPATALELYKAEQQNQQGI